ncbi:permease [Aneurinibacillus migulanus]|uniref:NCS2 family permease n=1 Tax=Aneurinibacillus migulanus TaxID=47500 RepID=UPI0005BAE065|nr:NCS2 family permease [Aneurinibacillus migulanus]KIV49882.1 permease [Aneurinibacillus migulanus]KPD07391.1 permease [Aneurinibacillus migulanus]CEH32280.1 Putative permease [Aneurinibacillus migulanus]
MQKLMDKYFRLTGSHTTARKEILAGTVSFFTIVYIIAVNSSIMADAGIPVEAGIIATILTSFVGCLLMGFGANAPIMLVPGMGINALFSYTLVQGMGLTWQEALAAVFVSGMLFALVAFTSLTTKIAQAIPESLKEAITVGIGLFLAFIGLQKGGIVVASPTTFVALGDFSSAPVLLTLATLLITVFLFIRNVPGNFLIGILLGTSLAALFGQIDIERMGHVGFSSSEYRSVFGAMSFDNVASAAFWIASFSMALVVVFENIGLIHSHLRMADKSESFDRAMRTTSLSVIACGLFGTSPTVATVESAAGIATGGKTGLTAVVTGMLFLLSFFFIPVIRLIPDSAIAPVLIIIGGLMIQSVRNIDFQDFSEGFPAFLVIALIPLTYSIVDGIAFGFIVYPLLKLALGRGKEIALPLYLIAGLFLLNFVFHAIGT